MKNNKKLEQKLQQLEKENEVLQKNKNTLTQQLHGIEVEIIQKSGAYKAIEELIKEK